MLCNGLTSARPSFCSIYTYRSYRLREGRSSTVFTVICTVTCRADSLRYSGKKWRKRKEEDTVYRDKSAHIIEISLSSSSLSGPCLAFENLSAMLQCACLSSAEWQVAEEPTLFERTKCITETDTFRKRII